MIEVEIKLPVRDGEEIETKLLQAGFVYIGTVHEQDDYFTSAYRDLKERDEALRIRSVRYLDGILAGQESTLLTFKGPKLDRISMSRMELETEVGNSGVMSEILKSLGFFPVPAVVKTRKNYLLKCKNSRMTINGCVDRVDKLGVFLELEVISEDERRKQPALEQIEKILAGLDHSMEETTRNSYLSMLMGLEDR